MTLKRIRKLRHWKQRFNENAKFVWRRSVMWDGEAMQIGSEVPESLATNRVKLKRFWESEIIELAEFEEPDVLTGRPPEPVDEEAAAKKAEEEAAAKKAEEEAAAKKAEEEAAAKKAEEEAAAAKKAEEEATAAKKAEEEATAAKKAEEDAAAAKKAEEEAAAKKAEEEATAAKKAEEDAAAAKKAEDLIRKETDRRWHVEGLEEVFTSKSKALEAVQALMDAF